MTKDQYNAIKELIWAVGLMILAILSDVELIFWFASVLSLISLVLSYRSDAKVQQKFKEEEM